MTHTGFSTYSNVVYIAPAFFVDMTTSGIALALSCICLAFGSGAYHLQHAKKNTFGHRWDEISMLFVLATMAAYVWESTGKPSVFVLWFGLLLMPPLSAAVNKLNAFKYVAVGSAFSLLPALIQSLNPFVIEPRVFIAVAVFILAVIVRGNDDNAFRHGAWHVILTVALCILIVVLR